MGGMSLELASCVDDEGWDQFVEGSSQGTVFCYSGFLRSLGESIERYFVLKEGQPVAAAVMLVRDGVPLPAPYHFSCYHGVLFSGPIEELPMHRRVLERLRLVDFLLAELSKRFRCLSFCLHHEFTDLRSFLWFNYHEPEKGKFSVELYYTGLLRLPRSVTQEEYLKQVRDVRRQEYNRAIREAVRMEPSEDIDLLDSLHDLTFRRQSISRSADEVKLLRSIAGEALKGGFGKLWIARLPSGEAASAYFFLFDKRCAYYLFAANHPDFRKSAASSLLMFEVIDLFRKQDINTFDFCGINSPNRGDFKTSFNASPTPYYVLNWAKPG